MNASPAIVSIGEPLIEFNRPKDGDGRTWLQGFGGDSQNVAIAAARQGASAGYLTSVGQDWMGDAFLELWKSEGVDASKVGRHPTAPTGVSFVTHGPAGHKFDYLRKNSAASLMTPADVPNDYIAGARFLHVSAIGQAISETARAACDAAIAAARASGVKVSYDTNLRLRLWDLETARAKIHATIPLCDVALPSLDDSQQLTGLSTADEIADFYLGLGAPLVALKMGSEGALLALPGRRIRIAAASRRGARRHRRRRHIRRRVPRPPPGGRRPGDRRTLRQRRGRAVDPGLWRGDADPPPRGVLRHLQE